MFTLFQAAGAGLGSDRGQAGLRIGALIVAAVLTVERFLRGGSLLERARRLGLGAPDWRGLAAAVLVCGLLLVTVPAFAVATGVGLTMYPGWLALLPGLFAQAGVAEEVLFRGYLFGQLRDGRSFWKAALIAGGPFVFVHSWLLVTMPWPIAAASIVLSAVIAFPLARLFDLGGGTIWAPALVHWVVQGVPKIVVPEERRAATFALAWMAASAAVPWLVFLYRAGPSRGRSDDFA